MTNMKVDAEGRVVNPHRTFDRERHFDEPLSVAGNETDPIGNEIEDVVEGGFGTVEYCNGQAMGSNDVIFESKDVVVLLRHAFHGQALLSRMASEDPLASRKIVSSSPSLASVIAERAADDV